MEGVGGPGGEKWIGGEGGNEQGPTLHYNNSGFGIYHAATAETDVNKMSQKHGNSLCLRYS